MVKPITYSPLLRQRLRQARATEKALELLFKEKVTCIIVQAGEKFLTVPVTAHVGAAVVHELLLDTIDTCEEVEQQLELATAPAL